jgi:G3E family GTPase
MSFEVPGRLHPVRVDSLFSMLLREYGADLIRIKGVFCMAHDERVWMIQGVHAAIDTRRVDWGVQEQGQTQCVLIGKGLDIESIRQGLQACVVSKGVAR